MPLHPRFSWSRLLALAFLLAHAAMPTALAQSADQPVADSAGGVEAALQQAAARRLHEEPEWLALLHALPGKTPYSIVDDPPFFLDPNGRRDLAAELRATLRALFATPVPGQRHAADRFPARQEWLLAELGLDPAQLPVPNCRELEEALAEFQPRSVHLVFPAAYLNSPASMFGHTLVRVKGKRQSDLLDRAINYAASTTETNGFVFAWRGLTGAYPGYFSLLPYYAKVQEYSAMDQRDIWEYELDFTPAEARRLLLHAWELREIRTDYYFLDENCSFNLLFLLDAARPGLTLARIPRFPGVVPVETVRRVHDAGLIRNTIYRPSQATRVQNLARQLAPADQELARVVSLGQVTPATAVTQCNADPARAATVLDLATENMIRLRGRREVAQDSYQPRFLAILQERSRLPATVEQAAPLPPRPDLGHLPTRLGLSVGSQDGERFAEFAIRPVHHALLDPPDGFPLGAGVEFANLQLRSWDGGELIELQQLELIRIRSLAPRDRFIQPLSWQAGLGVQREPVGDGRWRQLTLADAGFGPAWPIGEDGLAYALGVVEVKAGDMGPDFAIGAGAEAGLLWHCGRWSVNPNLRALAFGVGDTHQDVEAVLRQSWRLTPRHSLFLELGARHAWNDEIVTLQLGWWYYF